MKTLPPQLKQWIETIKPLIGIKHIIPPQIKSYIKIPQAPPREQIANIPCICNDPLLQRYQNKHIGHIITIDMSILKTLDAPNLAKHLSLGLNTRPNFD